MLSWCFRNNFIAPPKNFTAPKPRPKCTQPINEWCSSKSIASDCGVCIYYLFSLFMK